MKKNGIKYNIVKTYKNGVRVGNVPEAKEAFRRSGDRHSWFPKNWTDKTVIAASEYVLKLKKNAGATEGMKITGTYKGVSVVAWVGKNGISSIYPDSKSQPSKRRKRK